MEKQITRRRIGHQLSMLDHQSTLRVMKPVPSSILRRTIYIMKDGKGGLWWI
jgi:hypothetical protein